MSILEATYRVWLERPFDELTLEAVSEVAGVSRQTVHRHFGSKEELLAAVAAWRSRQEVELRAVPPGDVEAAVRRVVDRNEEMGDANVRALELEGRVEAVDQMLSEGRRSHRAWVEHTFSPHLPDGEEGARAVLALYAATDVTVWKLLRRDLGCSRAEAEATIRHLVEGVLAAGRPVRERRGQDGQ